jgi:hypothetical protein
MIMSGTLTLPASSAREKEKYTLPEAAIRKIEEKIDQGCRIGLQRLRW